MTRATPLHIQKGCGVPDKLSRYLPRTTKGVALDRFGVITLCSAGLSEAYVLSFCIERVVL